MFSFLSRGEQTFVLISTEFWQTPENCSNAEALRARHDADEQRRQQCIERERERERRAGTTQKQRGRKGKV